MTADWLSAITSVAALLVSIWAVWLLYRTLGETQKAVLSSDNAISATREIGEAQTRAYLSILNAKYALHDNRITLILVISNVGQSPARSVRAVGTVTLFDIIGTPEHPRVGSYALSLEANQSVAPIVTSGQTEEEIHFFLENDFNDEDQLYLRNITDEGYNDIEFDFVIRWEDVFEKSHSFRVTLGAHIDSSPYAPKITRQRKGSLRTVVADAKYGASQGS